MSVESGATTSPLPTPMSLREYAKRRGVSAMSVSRAVSGGRLTKSVVRDPQGNPKISDPELADREWDQNTDLSRAPDYVKERAAARANGSAPPPVPPPTLPDTGDEAPVLHEGMSLTEASAAEKFWRAKLAEQQFRARDGELVEVAEVEKKLVDTFTACRSKLLGIPGRARQALPHLSGSDVGVIEQLVRESLEDLVGNEADDDLVEPAA